MTWPDELEGPDEAAIRAEEEAYRVLRARVDLSGLPRFTRDVTERIVFTSADPGYVSDLICAEEALAGAVAALVDGAPVVADAPMTAAGISGWPVICKAGEPLTLRLARMAGISRPAAAARLAAGEAGAGAVWVVGCEPSAIYEILGRGTEPAFVIATPAGFAGAVEAKRALRGSGVPALTNIGEKGGPAVAAAACQALVRRAATARLDPAGTGADLDFGSPLSEVLVELGHRDFPHKLPRRTDVALAAVPCVRSTQFREYGATGAIGRHGTCRGAGGVWTWLGCCGQVKFPAEGPRS